MACLRPPHASDQRYSRQSQLGHVGESSLLGSIRVSPVALRLSLKSCRRALAGSLMTCFSLSVHLSTRAWSPPTPKSSCICVHLIYHIWKALVQVVKLQSESTYSASVIMMYVSTSFQNSSSSASRPARIAS